ncbi:MAG: RagB/SusD family nutrient uptake outer membrane protein, partial [Bacteroidota bacterium]|nr:RagB/SusD family nutrient uptake outer membrane protein [Bacteroidota bacterium]
QPNYNNANTLYDPANPYANRDPRFYASIYYNGSKRKAYWTFDELPECKENYDPSNPARQGNRTRIIATWKGEPKTGIDPLKRYGTRTGYYERKFLHPFAGDDYGVGAANFKYFRLGEIILNFAEAALEAGHEDEARDAVNEIRARVGMPGISSSVKGNDLRLRIRNERRVELALEEQRYFDVRRWSSPTGDLSKTDKWVTAMEILRNDDGTYTYTRRPVRAVERKCYTNKFLKVAIPIDEANLMKSLTGEEWQNPGW